MDLSTPVSDNLPKSRSASGGLLLSLGLLLLAIAIAAAAGVAGFLLIRALAPDVPAWSGLVIAAAAIVPVLAVIARRFEWIMPWYYLLPAILFLLAFTFIPVLLTITLAFTDYAGIRSGNLSVASETEIVAIDGAAITIADPVGFECDRLRNGCNGVRAEIYASGALPAAAEAIDDVVVTLAEAPPAGRTVRSVEMFLPDFGFAFEVDVVSVDGRELTIARAPPAVPDLEEVTLRLDRSAIRRTILVEDGATMTLDAPLPDGAEYVAIARFNDFGWIGLRNFREILRQATSALLPVFAWNLAFGVLTIALNTAFGVFIAVLLNNPALRFKAFYRSILIIAWALPNVITLQVWRGFLNENFGAINRVLMLLDLTATPVNWLGNAWAAKGAVLLVNLWLGMPFMMVATLGALSAIPKDVYEAARIDGANAWQSFWGVTAPLLRTALVPITLTGFAFNFNNFNVIFLLTDGGPPVSWGTATARGTDILISWAYNEAFRSQGGLAYGLGSAISIMIFVITIAISLINFRVTGALKEESNT